MDKKKREDNSLRRINSINIALFTDYQRNANYRNAKTSFSKLLKQNLKTTLLIIISFLGTWHIGTTDWDWNKFILCLTEEKDENVCESSCLQITSFEAQPP